MARAPTLILALAVVGTLVHEWAEAQTSPDSVCPSARFEDARPSRVHAATQPAESPIRIALRFFEALPPGDLDAALGAVRPPRIGVDERMRLLAMLPQAGQLTPNAEEQCKVAALEPVLAFHERAGVSVKVIDLPQANLVNYYGAALLVARPVFRLLSAAELQAAVAHEIAHEYFFAEYERARLVGNVAAQQAIELKCDGIAALTLIALDRDVSYLRSAMRKMIEFNETRVSTVTIAYPTLHDREIFVRSLLKTTVNRRR